MSGNRAVGVSQRRCDSKEKKNWIRLDPQTDCETVRLSIIGQDSRPYKVSHASAYDVIFFGSVSQNDSLEKCQLRVLPNLLNRVTLFPSKSNRLRQIHSFETDLTIHVVQREVMMTLRNPRNVSFRGSASFPSQSANARAL